MLCLLLASTAGLDPSPQRIEFFHWDSNSFCIVGIPVFNFCIADYIMYTFERVWTCIISISTEQSRLCGGIELSALQRDLRDNALAVQATTFDQKTRHLWLRNVLSDLYLKACA